MELVLSELLHLGERFITSKKKKKKHFKINDELNLDFALKGN